MANTQNLDPSESNDTIITNPCFLAIVRLLGRQAARQFAASNSEDISSFKSADSTDNDRTHAVNLNPKEA